MFIHLNQVLNRNCVLKKVNTSYYQNVLFLFLTFCLLLYKCRIFVWVNWSTHSYIYPLYIVRYDINNNRGQCERMWKNFILGVYIIAMERQHAYKSRHELTTLHYTTDTSLWHIWYLSLCALFSSSIDLCLWTDFFLILKL